MRATLLVWLCMYPISIFAQYHNYLSVGISANAYKGDLIHSYSNFTSALGGKYVFNKKKRINPSIGLWIGKFTAQNPDYTFLKNNEPKPVVSFVKTGFIAINVSLHLNAIKTERWTLYLAQGLGLFRFTPRDIDKKKLIENLSSRELGEIYGASSFILPTYIGATYTTNSHLGMGIEAGFHNTMNDYIDNVSLWGTKDGNDNLLFYRFFINIPIIKRT